MGPHTPMLHHFVLSSVIVTEPSSGRWPDIQALSCSAVPPPVTTMKRSLSKRVTVRSHFIPPFGVSIEV